MKSLHIVCLFALMLLTACKNEEKSPDWQTPDTTAIPSSRKKVTTTEKTAAWQGKYSGILPCGGDCKGMLTILAVNADNTYSLSSQSIGQEKKPRVFAGKFFVDEKQIITLDAEGDHLKFKIENGMLRKLDKFGDPEQGAPAARYLLHPIQ